jgi:hypothetical protein
MVDYWSPVDAQIASTPSSTSPAKPTSQQQQGGSPHCLHTTTTTPATTIKPWSKMRGGKKKKRARRALVVAEKANLLAKGPEGPTVISPTLLAGRTRAQLKTAQPVVSELTPSDGPTQGQSSRSTTSFPVCDNLVVGTHVQAIVEASNEDGSDDDEGSTGVRDEDSLDEDGTMTDTEQLAGKRGTDERSPAKAGMQQPPAKRRPPPTPAVTTATAAPAVSPSASALPTAATTGDSTNTPD